MSTAGELPRYSGDKTGTLHQQCCLVSFLKRHAVSLLTLFLAISAVLTVIYFSTLTKEVAELQKKVNALSAEFAADRNVNGQPLPSSLQLGTQKKWPRRSKRDGYTPVSHLTVHRRSGPESKYKRILHEHDGILSWNDQNRPRDLVFTNMILLSRKFLKINKEGLYQVYSQVTYKCHSERSSCTSFWKCGHEIKLMRSGASQIVTLISSFITRTEEPLSKWDSLYQAGVFRLESGDKLFVKLSPHCTNSSENNDVPDGLRINSTGETTFFGVFLVSS